MPLIIGYRRFLIFIFALLHWFDISSQTIDFQKITVRQGLSHSFVNAIAQDVNGAIWMATVEGMDKYDGYTVDNYPNDDFIPKCKEILSLLNVGKSLYVGTNSGVYKFDSDSDRFKLIDEADQTIGSVNNFYNSIDSTAFVCSKKGLFIINNNDTFTELLKNVNVRAISNYKSNVYFVALDQKILMINKLGEVLKEYQYPSRPNSPSLSGFYLDPILFRDKQGVIWLGTLKGLFKYNTVSDNFENVQFTKMSNQLEANVIRAIAEDKNNQLWIGTEFGLFIYDKTGNSSKHYGQTFHDDPKSLSDKSIHSLFFSKEGIAWIGTYFGGLNYSKPITNGFYKMLPSDLKSSLGGKAISQIIQHTDGKLWIATEDGGVTIYDNKKNQFEYLKHIEDNENSISSNNTHALLEDHDGNIWIGTFLGGLNHYNIKTGNIQIYKNDILDTTSISNDHVYSLLQLNNEEILVGTQYGLNIFHYKSNSFTLYKPQIFKNKFINDMILDKRGDLWVCTSRSGLFKIERKTNRITQFTAPFANGQGLNDNEVLAAYEDENQDLWFTTYKGGLHKWNNSSGTFESLSKEDGLSNNSVYGVLHHKEKGYYISTNLGLNFYDPKTALINTFTISDGLSTNQFNYKSFLKDKAGWMYFGSVNGLNYFNPDSLRTIKSVSNLHFKDFKLFNKTVKIADNSPLRAHIDRIDTLILKHNENAFTFEYVNIDYFSEGNNSYSYYLEGYEENWNHVGNNLSSTYTNLFDGDYTFHLKNTRVGHDINERQIFIRILPPFWKTNWAFALYALLILGSIYSYYRFLMFIQNKNMAIELQKIEKEKQQIINRQRLNFFTFISHEFKTPLTLIIASIEKLVQSSSNNSVQADGFLSIKQNAQKLYQLVQQLMQFRQMETAHAKLELRKGNIILFLKDTFYAFEPLFKSKDQQSIFTSNTVESTCYFDAQKLETIITNLISNAIKNTNANGTIKMEVEIISEHSDTENKKVNLNIKISDTGIGLSEEDQAQLYAPFYTNTKNDNGKSGSGIGLALVKSLVEFLQGTIEIKSQPTKGTSCQIYLPVITYLNEDQSIKPINGNKSMDIPVDLVVDNNNLEKENGFKNSKDLKLLIVEDNKELLIFLKKHFSPVYDVMTANNGKVALAKMNKTIPDVIISDIRMPQMDGLSFCKSVKISPRTRHIPFLLLTGQTSDKNKFKGLRFGANAYMSKPFNLTELDLVVKNLLDSNESLYQRFSSLAEKDAAPHNNQKKEFLLKITELIEKNSEDPGFTVDKLAKEAGVSRSLLHNKMKDITGHSALEYITQVRLDNAIIYLQEGYTVSEVAYKIGYEPSYFSRVFKKHYALTPKAFIKRKKSEEQ